MKKDVVKQIVFLLIIGSFAACGKQNGTELSYNQENGVQEEIVQEESQLSFRKLKDMPEISVEGNCITVALLQDISLPYRWAITWQSENATLLEEYEVEDPANAFLLSTGSAEEYHVFVFELAETGLAKVKFHNRWVVEPENLAEANGIRNFILEYTDGQWQVIAEE